MRARINLALDDLRRTTYCQRRHLTAQLFARLLSVESHLRAMLSRMVLGFINRVPPLKRRMLERMGEEE